VCMALMMMMRKEEEKEAVPFSPFTSDNYE
jgi:hypothetical protein